jgi:hypothetical protein
MSMSVSNRAHRAPLPIGQLMTADVIQCSIVNRTGWLLRTALVEWGLFREGFMNILAAIVRKEKKVKKQLTSRFRHYGASETRVHEKYRKFLEKRPDILQITEKPDDHQQRRAQEPTKE